MTLFTTFYLSRIINKKVLDANGNVIGIIKDLMILFNHNSLTSERPVVTGVKLKKGNHSAIYSFSGLIVEKINGKLRVLCTQLHELAPETITDGLMLAEVILDKQIVDLNGHKLVRVNDVRLVSTQTNTYAIAVDIGVEGLLRRIGISKILKSFLNIFKVSIPARFILWEDVEAVDFSKHNIKLSKTYSKLHTLHPSDLADIIEELGNKTKMEIFSSLDEEKAADVLEELEPEAQVQIIDSLPVEKIADVLEKMPADEVADILDELEPEKAELLLNEMEEDSSQDVMELLEYPDNTVGSMMTSDVLTFREDDTVEYIISKLRDENPENEELYNLFVTGEDDELIATFSLRDLLLSPPNMVVNQIMKPSPVNLRDYERMDDVAEIISKYNLLGIPVVDEKNSLQGMVVINDVVEDLINKRRTNK